MKGAERIGSDPKVSPEGSTAICSRYTANSLTSQHSIKNQAQR